MIKFLRPRKDCWESGSENGVASSGSYAMTAVRGVDQSRVLLAGLAAAALALCPLRAVVGEMSAPAVLLVPLIMLGGLRLRPRHLVVLLAVSAAALLYMAAVTAFEPVPSLVVAAAATLAVLMARARDGVGLRGMRGDRLLKDLQVPLKRRNQLPVLPSGWKRKVVVRQANRSQFGGDFIVSHLDDGLLQVAVVDVAGRGQDAASRAMMLSGALGGLLGAVPGDRFLDACNAYLLRDDAGEGMVTVTHLRLELASGRYTVASAGGPPPARLDAGSRTWRTSTASGIALGVADNQTWHADHGRLGVGDALMVYTDGVLDLRKRDLDAGIDRLLGEAGELVHAGFDKAGDLVAKLAGARNDDSTLVLIWRQ